ncbi:hypothetical protein SKAU_G00128780 [Synaphobranchus kaupii]|uniref:Uncharacterized protein n=1 Tax=Synaphobranchus kaupii TaxID=118154 RepID=A0A9Q1FQZ0_SYNKA|nr:hypothetical protein SKAU_G00128780 [Synaphobranchus kaupii]
MTEGRVFEMAALVVTEETGGSSAGWASQLRGGLLSERGQTPFINVSRRGCAPTVQRLSVHTVRLGPVVTGERAEATGGTMNQRGTIRRHSVPVNNDPSYFRGSSINSQNSPFPRDGRCL